MPPFPTCSAWANLYPPPLQPNMCAPSLLSNLYPLPFPFTPGLPTVEADSRLLPVSAAAEDSKTTRLLVIASTIRSLFPRQFLPNFKNPCWYVDYQISHQLLQTFFTNTPGQEDEAAKERIAKTAIAEMYAGGQTGGKQLVCLPYFFVLGYSKCGTTKLYEILKAHPHFAPPRIKEIHWFTKHVFEERFPSNTAYILRYFLSFLSAANSIEQDPAHKVTGDCSASYAFQLPFKMDITETLPNALPLLLTTLLPHSKYIVIVRHPIRRLLSEFYYFASKGCKTPANADTFHNTAVNHINAFNKCLAEKRDDYYCLYRHLDWLEQEEASCIQLKLEATLYVYTLQQWIQEIKTGNLLVLRNEDLEADDVAVATRLYLFLGLSLPIEPIFREFHGVHTNQQIFLQHPREGNIAIRNDTWNLLSDFFQPYNTRLADLLQDDAFLWKE